MVAVKGTAIPRRPPMAGDRSVSRGVGVGFKIYTENKASDGQKRKSVPTRDEGKGEIKGIAKAKENVPSKQDVSGKTVAGRKALANVSNYGTYILRNRSIDASKQLKPPDGSGVCGTRKASQTKFTSSLNSDLGKPARGKLNAHSNHHGAESCHSSSGDSELKMYSDRTKITASTSRFFEGKVASKHLVAKGKLETSITKRSGDNLSTLKGNVNKPRLSIRKSNNYANSVMGRNTLKEANGDTDRLPNNQSSNDSRHIQYPGGNRILLSSKKKSGILLARPRTSFTNQRAMSKKLMDTSASSRKNVGMVRRGVHASSKVKLISDSTCTLGVPKSAAENASLQKEVEVACQPILDSVACIIPEKSDLEKVHSDDDGSSKETVTAIISRPKRMRRRSYTSSLVERSKDKLPVIDDDTNPLEAVEYIEDIYEYYWIMEVSCQPSNPGVAWTSVVIPEFTKTYIELVQNPSLANYMDIQTDVTPRLRGILINWLIEVHHKFQLMEETLFLMVELNDRFLSMVSIEKDQLQLVGLTALLLASKYEDFWHPKIKDLISISANAYTRDQMLAMEKLILRKLKFRLSSPTPYVFMLRFLKAAQSDNKKLEHLAFYLIELCLVEYEALKFKPSLLCATAIYIARCTIHISPPWTAVLSKHARYEESQLRACGEMILSFHRAAAKGPLKVTYEKYLNPDRCRVAAIRPLSSLPT